jgi:Domain of unknown function (DUF4037)
MIDEDFPSFTPGLELARRFYWEAVRPVLDAEFPGLRHSAALIGSGSEVLGFDTPMSADHHWGPRAMLFLAEDDYERQRNAITETFRWRLPHRFLGYPTNFTAADDHGVKLMEEIETGPINHRIECSTLAGFFRHYIEFDINAVIEPTDWLTFGEQKLRTITAGEVFHDDLSLEAIRTRFAYYPRDVWLYMLASGWQRIGQEEHLTWRAGYVGDEIGSTIIAGRLVRDLMRLCFLMEQQYAPYPKWFGTAFIRLAAGPELAPLLQAILRAETWQERGERLATAYENVAEKQNALRVTEPLPATCSPFWGRPFPIIWGDRFADAIAAQISDPAVRSIARRGLIGGIDQFGDSTDLLHSEWRQAVRGLYV